MQNNNQNFSVLFHVLSYSKAKVSRFLGEETVEALSRITPVVFLVAIVGLVIAFPDVVNAQSSGDGQKLEDTLCKVINELTGPIGRGIAAIAVIFLGFSLFLGKISWGLALALALGIGAIFGAKTIVNALAGSGGFGSC